MPAPARPGRVLSAVAVAAALLAGSTGCDDKDGSAAKPSATVSPSPSASASASASASPEASVSAEAPPSPSPPAAAPTAATASATPPPAPAPPPAPTRLKASVDTRGGGLALVRGGAAQEFTVTLRNGNSAAYGHLLAAFQMEFLIGEPGEKQGRGPGFALERFDAASGTWKAAALRIANDRKPESMYTGGAPLAREAVRVERYRLRATAGGPTGSTPLMVYVIDTDADRSAATYQYLPHTTS
ncbi:hypothetical protein OTB20_37870 [Streptomyces sp. H27-H1]|uniref:hypothetical protein n=1 Tax=Streptomyces sp. H27-H1 TaxID=2996461 RepID=UPI0022715C37|nr:hypothetical protein [Streptomyces sp. H27-H1]MCY0931849.1 hypothetical protein [Streptomyces sp. H27-H1]